MADKNKNTLTLLGTGDIGPAHEPTDQFAELVLPVLRQADLRFGQCERTYSERSHEFSSHGQPSRRVHSRLDPSMASIWKTAGMDVISVASNTQNMEWEPEVLLALELEPLEPVVVSHGPGVFAAQWHIQLPS